MMTAITSCSITAGPRPHNLSDQLSALPWTTAQQRLHVEAAALCTKP
jgi:hypothetical protein